MRDAVRDGLETATPLTARLPGEEADAAISDAARIEAVRLVLDAELDRLQDR